MNSLNDLTPAGKPIDAVAFNQQGVSLREKGDIEGALNAYRAALRLQPDWPECMSNLADVLTAVGNHAESIAVLRRALGLSPANPRIHSQLLFSLHYLESSTQKSLAEEAHLWNVRHGEPLRPKNPTYDNSREPERRLRIGYVSSDFRLHPAAFFIEPLLRFCDPAKVEIFCYAQIAESDPMTERLQRFSHHFQMVKTLSDEALAQQIRRDKIDILVDLNLHSAENRLPVFARKPAPIQAAWLAYPGTTGLSAIDYRLSDRFLDPPEQDAANNGYSEESVRLPDSFWCYRQNLVTPEVGALPVLAAGHITFGCLNTFAKTSPSALAAWTRLLQIVPASRLILSAPPGGHCDRTLAFFAAAGIDPSRCEFLPRILVHDYYAIYNHIDIALDPFPCGGGTTTFDALWMGVPVITLAGATSVGRSGVSILSNAGLPELVTRTAEEYVACAAALARDLPRLAALRAALRTRLQSSPLMDGPRFARNMEAAYRRMWHKWCGVPASSASPTPAAEASLVRQTMQLALQHHQAGRLAQAEQGYREVLAREPHHPSALHLLGVLAGQVGKPQIAVDLISRAISLRPTDAAFHGNLGNIFNDLGRTEEAIQSFQKALSLNPEFADAHNNLGVALNGRGDCAAAIACFHAAIRARPAYPEAHNNLGLALAASSQSVAAIEAFNQAISLRPDFFAAHFNLGCILEKTGEFDRALASYRAVIALKPDHAESHNNLGTLLFARHEDDAAMASYRRALQIRPAFPEAANNLGYALCRLGQTAEAINCFAEALRLKPQYPEALLNLGNALRDARRLDEAIAIYHQAIALDPNLAAIHNNLGMALHSKAQIDAALASYQKAIALKPDFVEALNNAGTACKDRGQLDEAIDCFRRALQIDPTYTIAHSNLLYTLHFHTGSDAANLFAAHREWNDQHAAPLERAALPHANDRNPDRRLRLAYISPDLRDHVVGRFLFPLISHHNQEAFELFCYSDVARPDELTERLGSRAHHWRVILGRTDEQVARLIRNDGIDILVDLTMHMGHNRMLTFARKPAPIQVTYLAYCSTTGLTAMDYRLSDPWLDFEGSDIGKYSEKTVRLPETYWCYSPFISTPAEGDPPSQKTGYITFGSLNNFCKVSDQALDLWCQILAAVPNSRLILHTQVGSHRERVEHFFTRAGIDPNRCEFSGFMPRADYFAEHRRIDIILDPFPYAGGTTTCDALWMGVPVVTLAGDLAIGRGGVSILSNLGLRELIAQTHEEYIQIAINLARDPARLAAFRADLRPRMQKSALMDAPRFASNVEAAYRQMWRTWCTAQAQKSP